MRSLTPRQPASPGAARGGSARALLLLLALASLAGCGFDEGSSGAEEGPQIPSCESDAMCAPGLVCQASRCVDEARQGLTLAFQFHYGEGDDEMARQLSDVPFSPGQSIEDLQGQALVEVVTTVTRRTEPVLANVQFQAERVIPGTQLIISRDSGNSGARFGLLPGTYRVRVQPERSTGLPPRVFTQQIEPGPKQEPLTLSLPLVTGEEKLITLQGRLLLQRRGEPTEEPAQHVRITARTLDGLHTSNTLRTCATQESPCDGTFSLILPAQGVDETRVYELIVEPTSDNPGLPTLTLGELEVGPALLATATTVSSDMLDVALDSPFVARDLPHFNATQGVVIDAATGLPLEGVLVTAQGQVTLNDTDEPIETSYLTSAQGATGPDGVFTLLIADEGTLTLRATPPQSTTHAPRALTLQEPRVDVGITVSLLPQTALHGRVFGRTSDAPVANVEVSAEPTGASAGVARRVTATTDGQGRYSLSLDPGDYELVFTPPPASGLALRTRDLRVDEETAAEIDAVLLGRTSVVFGRVLDPEGAPAAGAFVEVFADLPGADTPRFIGEAVSDAEGIYRVIIPNPDSL